MIKELEKYYYEEIVINEMLKILDECIKFIIQVLIGIFIVVILIISRLLTSKFLLY